MRSRLYHIQPRDKGAERSMLSFKASEIVDTLYLVDEASRFFVLECDMRAPVVGSIATEGHSSA